MSSTHGEGRASTRPAGHPTGDERGLGLLRSETNRSILTALHRAPSSEAELKGWLVLRDGKKLGRHLKKLLAGGAIEKRRLRLAGRRVEYRLTDTGRALVEIIRGVEGWLERHPDRDLAAVSPVGWRAFGLLVDAWAEDTAKLLAGGPRSLRELAAAVEARPERVSRDLAALQGAGIVVAIAVTGEIPERYTLSEWGILGIGVLALGAHWQQVVEERPLPIAVEEALTALAVSLPLAHLPASESGSCALTVELEEGREGEPRIGALRVEIREGVVDVDLAIAGQPPPDAWARGTISEWLAATVTGRPSVLNLGGNAGLVVALIGSVHVEVFGR